MGPAAIYEPQPRITYFDPVAYHAACNEVDRLQDFIALHEPKVEKLDEKRLRHTKAAKGDIIKSAGFGAAAVAMFFLAPIPVVGQVAVAAAGIVGVIYLLSWIRNRMQVSGTRNLLDPQQKILESAQQQLALARDQRRRLAPPPFMGLGMAQQLPLTVAPPADFGLATGLPGYGPRSTGSASLPPPSVHSSQELLDDPSAARPDQDQLDNLSTVTTGRSGTEPDREPNVKVTAQS